MADFKRTDALGAAITPEEWASFVLEHLSHYSVVLASGARRIDTHAKQIHVPRVTDDGGVGWYDELEEIKNDAPEGDDLVLTPKKVAALNRLSNESVDDSDPSALDTVGKAMLRAIGLEADRAVFAGAGGKQPIGILANDAVPLPEHPGAVNYEGLVRAAGEVRAEGGEPDVAYISPLDLVELQLESDGADRPLLQSANDGPAQVVAGLHLWPTPALAQGEALVAEAEQIVVAVRKDAAVAFSTDAAFDEDGTAARVIARLDAGVNDPAGLCVLGGGS